MGIGRRQKLQAVRELQGSRKRPHQHQQPRPAPGRPVKPAYLGPVAAAMWEELASLLEAERRLSRAEGQWLIAASEAFADYMRWQVEAQDTPLTQVKVMVDGTGAEHQEQKAHPVHQQVRLARKAWGDLLKEGGFTPASRARVSVVGDDLAVDPTETFLRAVK